MGCRNFDEFWFGWMEIGFDWWIMFGMMFGVVWVKKFVIWWRFEGDMKVWRFLVMEIFREWFEGWEIFLMKNEGRRKGKKLGIWWLEVWHGRATTGTAVPLQARAVPIQARAVPSFWFLWVCKAWSGTGRARLLAFWAQIFFSFRFLESCSDNYLQNNLKQTKTNKNRLNAWVASHEALV